MLICDNYSALNLDDTYQRCPQYYAVTIVESIVSIFIDTETRMA